MGYSDIWQNVFLSTSESLPMLIRTPVIANLIANTTLSNQWNASNLIASLERKKAVTILKKGWATKKLHLIQQDSSTCSKGQTALFPWFAWKLDSSIFKTIFQAHVFLSSLYQTTKERQNWYIHSHHATKWISFCHIPQNHKTAQAGRNTFTKTVCFRTELFPSHMYSLFSALFQLKFPKGSNIHQHD